MKAKIIVHEFLDLISVRKCSKKFCPPERQKDKKHINCFALIHDLGNLLHLLARKIQLDFFELWVSRNNPHNVLDLII